MFKDVRIKERLTKAFVMVTSITAVAAVVGLIAMIVMSNRYAYALDYFGFAQGDIGKALVVFADTRSSLRAAIGYQDQDAIDAVVADHDEKKARFENYFAQIEGRLTTEESKGIYNSIKTELEEYWKLDQEILELGAVIDSAKEAEAQEKALNELTPAYNAIYEELAEILNIKVNSGNESSELGACRCNYNYSDYCDVCVNPPWQFHCKGHCAAAWQFKRASADICGRRSVFPVPDHRFAR